GYTALYSDGAEATHKAALQSLRHLLAARTFLFVGFSLDDDRFVEQLDWVSDVFSGANGPHYVIARTRDAPGMRHKLALQKTLEFIDAADFGGPLIRYLEQLATAQQPVPRSDAAPPRNVGLVSPASPSLATPGDRTGGNGVTGDETLSVREAYRTVYQ